MFFSSQRKGKKKTCFPIYLHRWSFHLSSCTMVSCITGHTCTYIASACDSDAHGLEKGRVKSARVESYTMQASVCLRHVLPNTLNCNSIPKMNPSYSHAIVRSSLRGVVAGSSSNASCRAIRYFQRNITTLQ